MNCFNCAQCETKDEHIEQLQSEVNSLMQQLTDVEEQAQEESRMSKPLREKSSTKSSAAKWHREVFSLFGRICFFCGNTASDAAHIVKRSRIGTRLAYCSPEIGRSLCRACHIKQECGAIEFPLNIRQQAMIIVNSHAKVPLPIPQE